LRALPGLLVVCASLGAPLVFDSGIARAAGGGPQLLQVDFDSGHVELAWTAVQGASSYTVYRDGTAIIASNTLRTTDAGNAPGSSHSYSVTATVSGSETGTSPTVLVSVPAVLDTQAPTTPSNLHTTSVGSTSATLAWSKSTDDVGVIGYFVRVGSVLYTFSEGSLSLNVPYLKAATTYGFDVTAFDASGKESAPAHINVTTAAASTVDTTPPSTPTLTATPYSGNQIDLSWSKPGDSDLTGFLVYRGSVLLEDIPPNSSAQTRVLPVGGLNPLTAYTFSVKAYDEMGNQSSPSTKTVTTLALSDVRVTRGPYVQRISSNSARIVWRTNTPSPSNLTYSDGVNSSTVVDPTPRTDHSVLVGPFANLANITYTLNYSATKAGNFRTCADAPATLHLDAVGDMGGGSTPEKDIANLVAGDHPDLIAALGDNVYPTGLDKDYPARFLTPYASALAGSAFFTAFGNHEYYSPGASDAHRNYTQPGNETYFSFDCSGVHISVVDAYQPYGPGSRQYQWLADDLSTTIQPWKIVVVHVPPYSSSVAGTAPGAIGVLDSLYEQNGVQLVIGGHSHNYERSNVLNGVTYLVDGGGGNGLNPFSGSPPSWSAYRASEYSYARFTITPTALTGTEVRQNGTTGDSFTIAAPVATAPDTVIDSAPPAQTRSASASISFHATQSGATFQCSLDGGSASACSSAVDLLGLAEGAHTFSVRASTSLGTDPTPAVVTWTVDQTAPTTPTLTATAPSSGSVNLAWSAATDANGITSYNITKDGNPFATVPSTNTTYADTAVTPGVTYAYTIVAHDPAGNTSAPSNTASATVPVPAANDFSIGASPSAANVSAGQSATSTITTTVTSGAAQSVGLSASGLPSGASASFNPPSISSGQSSTLTISTSILTPVGTAVVTITGTGSSATHATTLDLTVNPASGPVPQLTQWVGATETAAATTLTATFPATTGAGHLLVLGGASVYTGATNNITSVTDSGGNTWVPIGRYSVSGHNSDGEMWYAQNAVPVTSVTIHTASATVVAMTVEEFSGIATTNALDVSVGIANTGTTPASGSATPTASNDLAVGFIAGHGNVETINVTAPGFTALAQQVSSATTIATERTGYQVLNSSSSQNFTGSFATAMYWASGLAFFRAAT
jgi:fibronectin type 3 domain-containing protein